MRQFKNCTIIIPVIIFFLLLLFSGCYISEKTYGVAYLHNAKPESLEIELPYFIKGRGSFHNITFEKFKDSSSHWIYISKLEKSIAANRLTLIYQKGYKSQSNLKGEINIEDSVLKVNFKIPRYTRKSIVRRWINYEFNGTYKLVSVL